jgi:hypothetical protein
LGESEFKASLGKSLGDSHLKSKAGCGEMHLSSVLGRKCKWEDRGLGWLRHKARPNRERAGAPVVQHLPNKHEA